MKRGVLSKCNVKQEACQGLTKDVVKILGGGIEAVTIICDSCTGHRGL